MADRIRVLVVDDHTIVRQGLVALLETAGDLEVVGEAGDGRAALAQLVALQPEVLVCDLALPGLGGLEVIRRLPTLGLDRLPRVVVLSMYHDPVWVQRALDGGAHAYLLKGSGVQDLVKAIRLVHGGERYLSPGARRSSEVEALSPREREVLTLLAEGHTSKEIGSTLGISHRTAEHHRARLMAKLGINDVAGLTRYAIRRGLVDENLK